MSGRLFTSESVTEGHPDKIADQISDSILDACLSQDTNSRVACETLVNTGMAVISGELTTSAQIDITDLVRKTVCDIGYDKGEYGYDGNNISVLVSMDKQSADIAQGRNWNELIRPFPNSPSLSADRKSVV